MMAALMFDDSRGKPMSSGVNRMRSLPSARVACVACVRMMLPDGFCASSKPAYPKICFLSVIATAIAAVDGSSNPQIFCAAL